MKRKPIIHISALLFLLIFISCGTINKGIIVEKKHLPSRTLYASGVYNQTNERYQIIIEGKSATNKSIKRKYFVRKQEYDSLKVGNKYTIIK